MSTDRADLFYATALAAGRLSRRIGVRLSAHGISFTEYLVLRYLAISEGRSVPRVELAEHMGMSASGITRLLLPMEKRGLVERDASPRDARQSLVKIAPGGEQLHAEAQATVGHFADTTLSQIDDSDIGSAVAVLESMP